MSNFASFESLYLEYAFQAAYAGHDPAYKNDPAFVQALQNLASAIAHSDLNKLIDLSFSSYKHLTMLQGFKHDIESVKRFQDKVSHVNSEHCFEDKSEGKEEDGYCSYDEEGKEALKEFSHFSYGDGYDLVQEACVAILQETEKQAKRTFYAVYNESNESVYAGYVKPSKWDSLPAGYDREEVEGLNFLEWFVFPYTERQFNRKVWIKEKPSAKGWKDARITPIQAVFKAVRRAIDNSRAKQTDPRNGYSYYEDVITDPKTGKQETYYQKLAKYSMLGSFEYDFNGQETFYTVEKTTVESYEALVKSLSLTEKQAKVLELKERGFGNKAIATYLGFTENMVKGCMTEIRRKAKERGIVPKGYKGE